MEASLQIQSPFSLRNNSTNSKIRLSSRSFSNGRFGISFHSSPGCKEFPGNSVKSLIRATADYPRRRPRKSSNPRPSPKGFVPKTQVGTGIQKRDQNGSGEKESSSPSSSNEYTGPENKLTETKADAGEEQMSEVVPETSLLSNQVKTKIDVLGEAQEQTDEIEEKKDETPSMEQHSPTINSHDIVEKGTMAGTDEDKAELGAPEILKKVDVVVDKEPDVEEALIKEKLETEAQARKETLMKQKLEMEARARAREEALMKWKVEMEAREREEALMKEKLEMEARAREEALMKQKLEMEARARKKLLEELAEENFLVGNKLFVHPQVVKADQSIEVFLNRSLSTLKGESDVLIMGAFNDWRWKSFTKKMQKTDLKGDWWSCQVDIPKEAYNMDFVFFNGGDVYENNSSKDFFIPVESGMDASAFENFLLEEKRRELERLAAEEAERERQAEEQRRLEAEKAASEADRAQAKMEIEKRREILFQLMKKAEQSVDNVCYIEPSEFKGEDMVKLYYNRSSGPLAQAEEVWIHGGHNNWKDGLTIVERLICEKDLGDWWYADVVVPDRSLVLDWVFADGPPQSAKVYDNNNYEDFHATVPNRIPEELYWVEEEHQIYKRLQEERKQREEAIRAKAEKTARLKAETREKTMKMFLLSQKHIVYTEPLEVRAGTTVTVFYNPSNTVLNGKPEVWFRCSFNRWTHRNGPLPPKKMTPAENGPHVKVTGEIFCICE